MPPRRRGRGDNKAAEAEAREAQQEARRREREVGVGHGHSIPSRSIPSQPVPPGQALCLPVLNLLLLTLCSFTCTLLTCACHARGGRGEAARRQAPARGGARLPPRAAARPDGASACVRARVRRRAALPLASRLSSRRRRRHFLPSATSFSASRPPERVVVGWTTANGRVRHGPVMGPSRVLRRGTAP